jgi:DnaJ like chaperone protein
VAELRRIPSPGLGLIVLDLLYQIAQADFELHLNEEEVLAQIADAWGLADAEVRTIRSRYSSSKSSAPSSEAEAYQTLGLRLGSSQEEVKDAYRRLVKQFHPDVVAHLGEDFKQLADQKMKAIMQAYQQLV